jgi:hypothetical protein
VLRQLLLLPLLAPLMAVFVVGALNPKPQVSLRLLTYTTPPLPIGVWMMLAAAGGGLLSAGGTGLALRSGPGNPLQRQVRRPLDAEANWAEASTASAPPPRPATQEREWPKAAAAATGPSRSPAEPPPTVEVPFRVIRRASSPAAATASEDDWNDTSSDW